MNRLPSQVLNWKTPYELLYGKIPDYSFLRIFGCLAYATNSGIHKSKFEPRAQKCIFIGFSPGQKAYKLYNLDTEKILVSRDVVFYEDIFPFQAECIKQDIESLPLPLTCDMDNALDVTEGADIIQEHADDSSTSDATVTRKQSTRQRRTPRWMNDYVINRTIAEDVYTEEDFTITLKAPTAYTPHTFPYNIPRHLKRTYVNYLTNLSTACKPCYF